MIFRDVWLCKGLGVTSDSEIQHLYPTWRQGQGGINPTDRKSEGWGSDGTASSVAGIIPPEDREPEARGPGR